MKINNTHSVATELKTVRVAEADKTSVRINIPLSEIHDSFEILPLARGEVPATEVKNPVENDKEIRKKKNKQVVQQITFDSAVTALETGAIKASAAIGIVSEQALNLRGFPKLMGYIGESPIFAGKVVSGVISGAGAVSAKVAPNEVKIITDVSQAVIQPIEKAVPAVKKSVFKTFPKTVRFASKALPYAAVGSAAGFAIYDTKNAIELKNNPLASQKTKDYAVATAGLSYLSLAASTALILSPKLGKAGPMVAAISGGTSFLSFGASIYTSVKMEWSKNDDGINK